MKCPVTLKTEGKLNQPIADCIGTVRDGGTLVVKLKRRTKDERLEWLENKCHELLSENQQLKKELL